MYYVEMVWQNKVSQLLQEYHLLLLRPKGAFRCDFKTIITRSGHII